MCMRTSTFYQEVQSLAATLTELMSLECNKLQAILSFFFLNRRSWHFLGGGSSGKDRPGYKFVHDLAKADLFSKHL